MASTTSGPACGRQRSREGLELAELNNTGATTGTAAVCSVDVITSGPPFGESKSKPKGTKQVQFEDEDPQRTESDGPRCIGRAGTYHNPEPTPEFLASAEELLNTPTTPVGEARGRLASISFDGSRKPYINLHKVYIKDPCTEYTCTVQLNRSQ